jgi:hypothetical protein
MGFPRWSFHTRRWAVLTEILLTVVAYVGISLGLVSYDAADAHRVSLQEVACYISCPSLCLAKYPVGVTP